jgi:hypothetical protein
MAAADAVRQVKPPDALVLVGGSVWRTEVLRFSLGYGVPSRNFDDCGPVPLEPNAVYLLDDERSPAATTLTAAGAPLLARVARADGAFVVLGPPRTGLGLQQSRAQALNCGDREPQARP